MGASCKSPEPLDHGIDPADLCYFAATRRTAEERRCAMDGHHCRVRTPYVYATNEITVAARHLDRCWLPLGHDGEHETWAYPHNIGEPGPPPDAPVISWPNDGWNAWSKGPLPSELCAAFSRRLQPAEATGAVRYELVYRRTGEVDWQVGATRWDAAAALDELAALHERAASCSTPLREYEIDLGGSGAARAHRKLPAGPALLSDVSEPHLNARRGLFGRLSCDAPTPPAYDPLSGYEDSSCFRKAVAHTVFPQTGRLPFSVQEARDVLCAGRVAGTSNIPKQVSARLSRAALAMPVLRWCHRSSVRWRCAWHCHHVLLIQIRLPSRETVLDIDMKLRVLCRVGQVTSGCYPIAC